MFTYIQIIDKDSEVFKGYVYFKFDEDKLSMTMNRGMKALHRITIPISKIIDLTVENFYGVDRISFFYGGKKYTFINTGYGEAKYLKDHILKIAKV